jgi:hypothetical protein
MGQIQKPYRHILRDALNIIASERKNTLIGPAAIRRLNDITAQTGGDRRYKVFTEAYSSNYKNSGLVLLYRGMRFEFAANGGILR